jgi:hypothetical protein
MGIETTAIGLATAAAAAAIQIAKSVDRESRGCDREQVRNLKTQQKF